MPSAIGSFFFFNDTATTEIYTLSLHDALPISVSSLTISPRSMVVSIGTPRRFAVQLGDSMGNPVGRRVAWHSRDTVVARVDTGGLVSGLATGNAVVVATSERRDDSAVVQIVEPTLVGA